MEELVLELRSDLMERLERDELGKKLFTCLMQEMVLELLSCTCLEEDL